MLLIIPNSLGSLSVKKTLVPPHCVDTLDMVVSKQLNAVAGTAAVLHMHLLECDAQLA